MRRHALDKRERHALKSEEKSYLLNKFQML